MGGVAQSVYRLATGWTVRGSNPSLPNWGGMDTGALRRAGFLASGMGAREANSDPSGMGAREANSDPSGMGAREANSDPSEGRSDSVVCGTVTGVGGHSVCLERTSEEKTGIQMFAQYVQNRYSDVCSVCTKQVFRCLLSMYKTGIQMFAQYVQNRYSDVCSVCTKQVFRCLLSMYKTGIQMFAQYVQNRYSDVCSVCTKPVQGKRITVLFCRM